MTKISNLYTLTNYISANSSGNVVIAAPASGYALDVTGTGRFTSTLLISSSAMGAQINGGTFTQATASSYSLGIGNTGGFDLTLGTSTTAGVIQTWSSKPLALNPQGNNVGIGTNSPTSGKLEIQQSATTAGLWVQTGGTTSSYTIADFRTGTNLSALQIFGDGISTFGSRVNINGAGDNASRSLQVLQRSGYSSAIRVIADTSTSALIEFLGSGASSQPTIGVTSATPDNLTISTGGSTSMTIDSSRRVGIGTNALSGTGSNLQVEQSGTPNIVAIRRGDSSNTGAARILWQAYNASSVIQNTAIIEAGLDGSSTEGYLALSAGTPATPQVKLTYAGRLLIGINASVDYLTKLRVHNATDSCYIDVTTPVGDATLRLAGTYGQIRNEAGDLYISCGGATGDMILRTGSFTERMRLYSDGRIRTTVNGVNGQFQIHQTNSGYNSDAMMYLMNNRNATSSYNFAKFFSGYPDNTQDVEFLFRGDGVGFSDGGWTSPASDYAEYFESSNGQSLPIGSTVVLEDGKIRLSTESDTNIIGVIRPKNAALFLGNNANTKWNQKYLKDDFGAYILDEEGMRTLNPAYDSSYEYIPREKRNEWNIVGLVGQVPVLKSQPVGFSWVKMYDVSSTVEMWLIK